jgi:general secretion pathway protein G
MSQTATRARAARGVTLFEVLIVVALMAMLSSAIAVAVITYWDHAKQHHAETTARTIRGAVKIWWMEHDSSICPKVEDLLHDGTLERGGMERDPWGGAWSLECDGRDVTVSSNGSDRKPDTSDDIRVPPPERGTPQADLQARSRKKRGAPPPSRMAVLRALDRGGGVVVEVRG